MEKTKLLEKIINEKEKSGEKTKNVHTFGTANPRDPEPIFPVPQSGRSPGSQFKHPLLPSR